MATLAVSTFKGAQPRTHKRLLGNVAAQEAVNCRFDRGILEPLTAPLSAQSATGAKTIFKHDSLGWLSWAFVGNVVKSAIADSGGHYFLTGDTYPKQGTTALGAGTTRRLGLPRPTGALSVQLNGAAGQDVQRSSSYCYTYITDMGAGGMQESAPSAPTGAFDVMDGQTVILSAFTMPNTGTYPGVTVSKFRIYRTISGQKSANFFFVAEINASGVASYDDSIPDDQMSAEIMATTDWDMPPSDSTGMILTPNGIYAMHRQNEILLSEPFVPYAYPEKYRLSTQDMIVGMGFIESTVIVLTQGRPMMLVGSTPESMAVQPIAFDQSCVSKRSIVSTPHGVMYASPDGLCIISSGGPQVVTRNLYTKEQWQALGPSLMIGAYFEDKYFAFFDNTTLGLIYDFSMEDVREVSLSGVVTALFQDALTDTLYINHGGYISSFGGSASPLTMRWKSGEFFTSTLMAPAAVRVEGEQTSGSPTTLKLYAGDTLRHTASVSTTDPILLPQIQGAKAWTFELSGTRAVYEVRISTSVEELEHGV